ncbi:Xaa-Pro aminopeptidase [Nematocida sp. AWRm77]|nr:Xaa-Pro aminopeptidase [Nematocida sp. AWRm77]
MRAYFKALFIFEILGMDKLAHFRKELKKRDLDGYVLYRRDPHLNEYIHPYYNQVEYLSGFTGSNGAMLVLEQEAFLFTDSRYFIQARKELPEGIALSRMQEDPSIEERLQKQKGKRIGVDPQYITEKGYAKLVKSAAHGSSEIVLVEEDLVGLLWEDRPQVEASKLSAMENKVSFKKKIEMVRDCMEPEASKYSSKEELDGVVISDMDEIAWITNLRGTDVPMSRLFYAYMYITPDKTVLFTDAKLEQRVSGLEVLPYGALSQHLAGITGKSIGVSGNTNYHIVRMLEDNKNAVHGFTSVEYLKGIKTQEEIAGFEEANKKDAAALCILFGKIKKAVAEGVPVGEVEAAEWLLQIKQKDPEFIAPSFDTISAYGENGAIIHYSPKNNEVKIGTESLFLLDSGSQYTQGTTDITRTVSFGQPTESQKKHYTAMIKGHISLESTHFPVKTALGALASIVRKEIWKVGENYAHGTGHGVGYGLNVHEGPHFLEPSSQDKAVVGMVVTNEPGVYIEGKYGMRHENLMCVEASSKFESFLVLRNLTPVPLHMALIDEKLLTVEEIRYINTESQRMHALLSPLLAHSPEGLAWLNENTKQLEEPSARQVQNGQSQGISLNDMGAGAQKEYCSIAIDI